MKLFPNFVAVNLALFLSSTITVGAYVTTPPGGQYGTTQSWTPSSSATIAKKKTKDASAPTGITSRVVDEVFRDEYMTWAQQYGKPTSPQRFEIFKQNYMMQMQQNKRVGKFYLLNEYGDMTEAEFEMYQKTGLLSSSPSSFSPQNKEEEEASVAVEVELVTESEAELRQKHHRMNHPNTAPSATSPAVPSSTIDENNAFFGGGAGFASSIPKVTPLFTNHQAKTRGGAVPGSLNDAKNRSYKKLECRHKYTTGGTQFLGVRKRLVRWTPDMPR